jgi:hypothetical protein
MPTAYPRTAPEDRTPDVEAEVRFVQIVATRSLGGYDLVYGLTHDGRVFERTTGGWKALSMTDVTAWETTIDHGRNPR